VGDFGFAIDYARWYHQSIS